MRCSCMNLWVGVGMCLCTCANSLDASLIDTLGSVLLRTGTQLFKPVNLGSAKTNI